MTFTNVPILNNQNFSAWETSIVAQFDREELSKHIDGRSKKPICPPNASDIQKAEFERQYNSWESQNLKGNALLMQSVSSNFQCYIKRDRIVLDNFKAICSIFISTSANQIRVLKRQLESLKAQPHQSIQDFYVLWFNKYQQIIDAGGSLSNLEQVEFFLTSLPDSDYGQIKSLFNTNAEIPARICAE